MKLTYDKQCKTCGYRLSSYYKTGYLNCPDCYREFEAEISATVGDIQGGNRHKGKKPALTGIERELISDYYGYLKAKEKAGLEGNFAEMSKLNSLISQISEELKRRGLL